MGATSLKQAPFGLGAQRRNPTATLHGNLFYTGIDKADSPARNRQGTMKASHVITVITAIALISLFSPASGEPVASTATQASGLPAGVIVMWSGSLDSVPDGWALCDGSNGTPDLRNRFVLGVGAPEYLGGTGGAYSHRHQAREHSHQIDLPPTRLRPLTWYSGYGNTGTRSRYYMFPGQTYDVRPFKSGPASTTQDSVSNLPPYYKLAFIMKQ